MCACVLNCVWLFVTPWTVACQAPLSMEFSRQQYWSGLPFPSPGELPNPEIESASPALVGGFFTTMPTGKPIGKNGQAEIYPPTPQTLALSPPRRALAQNARPAPTSEEGTQTTDNHPTQKEMVPALALQLPLSALQSAHPRKQAWKSQIWWNNLQIVSWRMFPTLGGARSESTGPGQAFLRPSTVNPGGWGRYVAGQTMCICWGPSAEKTWFHNEPVGLTVTCNIYLLDKAGQDVFRIQQVPGYKWNIKPTRQVTPIFHLEELMWREQRSQPSFFTATTAPRGEGFQGLGGEVIRAQVSRCQRWCSARGGNRTRGLWGAGGFESQNWQLSVAPLPNSGGRQR